ncbi:hypothetical protein F511_37207 [Dorcoceras hygrometricum]|uniref:Triacylglycerol lipase n=1 Tax=Dorcoceras hygrometricum TaxID=472368 RepID=A0A2Z7BXT7_9LAMI|nr:hypothetical protein F511_37207 [Dorcoceras hygrometricum]
MDLARTETPLHDGRNKSGEGRRVEAPTAARGGREEKRGIHLAVGSQPLWLRNHNFGLAQRIMVKRLTTSRHDPLGITDSACKNQLVVVSVQYGPFNTYIPIRSTTIDKSRVARDPIAMHTFWRSNSDITSVTRVSMTFRVLRTNQYNQDLGLIHSKNGNHLESPNEGSSIDHQAAVDRQSGPRPDSIFLQSAYTRKLMDLARTETPLHDGRNKSGEGRRVEEPTAARGGQEEKRGGWPIFLGYNQLVVVSVQYDPFNTYIPIRSTTIGKSRVARDPIALHTSWRSNSDITSVTRVSMTFRVVRTNQYNQDLRLIHSTNGNHLESPNEGISIDHQITIHLHAQNITIFPTNEIWYFASQMLVSSSGGLILILTPID